MRHFDITSPTPKPIERPPCVRCGAQMLLTRIVPSAAPGVDQRCFKCTGCGQAETVQVKY